MPWQETDVRDQRIRFVVAAGRPGAKIAALCREFGISRKTAYKWRRRDAAAQSVLALVDRSRRPHRSPRATSTAVTQRIVALRQQYGWGGEKLQTLLAAEGVQIAARTVDRIIARAGLTRPDTAPSAALRRFTRDGPNDLWQMDAKGYYPVANGPCHPLSIVDDYSRFAVGLYALRALEGVAVQAALVECFEQYGVPTEMLMDHGSPWWSTSNPAGLTRLSVFLLKQDIRLRHGRVHHPQTQGKVERFHRTLGERLRWWGVPSDFPGFERALAAFRAEYNDVRPHEALGQQPPVRLFRPSARAYVADPRPWEYPPGSEVRRVDHAGMLSWAGQRVFISEALVAEEVACVRVAERLLVVYRDMYVREVHLRTGRSQSLLQPLDAAGLVDATRASTRSLEHANDAFSTPSSGHTDV